jgi:hypothetical protein
MPALVPMITYSKKAGSIFAPLRNRNGNEIEATAASLLEAIEWLRANPLQRGNEKLLGRMLNDPYLRHFRTAPGYVAVS